MEEESGTETLQNDEKHLSIPLFLLSGPSKHPIKKTNFLSLFLCAFAVTIFLCFYFFIFLFFYF